MKRLVVLYCLLVLTVMLLIEVASAVQESQTYDEAVHLASGLSYWRTGSFRLNPEHPPILKLLASAPLLLTPAKLPLDHPSWSGVDEWEFSDVFLYQNVLPPQTMLLLGRLPIMLLSLLLGWWIFKASREMFGNLGAALSVTLYAFDPNIVAHSRYITTDLGFTALAFFSIYRLTRLLQQPSPRNWLIFGLVFLAASLSKFSSLAFSLALVGVFLILKIVKPSHSALSLKKLWRGAAIAIPAAFMIIWSLYGFDIRRPLDDPRIARLYEERQQLLDTNTVQTLPRFERFIVENVGDRTSSLGQRIERLQHLRYPAYTFFRGLSAVISHATGGHGTYLLGQVNQRGWWYYFPVAFAAKTPLPTLIAIVAVLAMFTMLIARRRRTQNNLLEAIRSIDLRWLVYLATPILFFTISIFSHLNLGWRHIMPIYPFWLVLAGSLAVPVTRQQWSRLILPLLLIANIVIVQAGTFPNEIGYFNSLVGGSRNGPNILLDSNLDWGQDLPKLAAFVRQHALSVIPFAYYGRADVTAYLDNAVPLPTTDAVAQSGEPMGFVAISVGELMRPDGQYRWLWNKIPVTVLGSGIYVYRLAVNIIIPFPLT